MLDRLLVNWPLKLLALALAFGIWVSVTGDTAIVQDFRLPLTVTLPENLTLSADPPTTVNVRLRGPETQMRRMDTLRLAVSVDLRDGAAGQRDVTLSRTNLLGVPQGVEMNFIDPNRISLVVDRKVRRSLPVEPTLLGRPPEGYAFYSAEVRPSHVVVEGPEAEVQDIEVLRTNAIRLDEFTRPTDATVAMVPDSPHVRVVDPAPLLVRVIVDATPEERKFTAVPVVVTGASTRASVTPETISVTLAGPPALLNGLVPDQLQAVADVTDRASGQSYQVDLVVRYRDTPVQLNPRISITSVSRSSARVELAGRRPSP